MAAPQDAQMPEALDAQIAAHVARCVADARAAMRAQLEDEWAGREFRTAPRNAASAARPDKYKGGAAQLNDWLFRMDLFLRTTGVNPNSRDAVDAACSYLEGDAFSWWRLLSDRMEREGSQPVTTWTHFNAALKDRFQIVDEGRKARIALANLRQSGSVRAYTQEFQRLMLLSPETHELDLIVRYQLGLHGAVRAEVDRGQPTTILQAMKLADEADVRLSGYRLERTPPAAWQQPRRPYHNSGPTGMELGTMYAAGRPGPGRGSRPPARGGQRSNAPRANTGGGGNGGGPARNRGVGMGPPGGYADVKCYNCGRMGHMSRHCTAPRSQQQQGNVPARA